MKAIRRHLARIADHFDSFDLTMSIAVSAVVCPSRLLRAITLAAASGTLLVGAVIGVGAIGRLPAAAELILSLLCCGAAWLLVRRALAERLPHRIDISGNGQIRLVPLPETMADVPGPLMRGAADEALFSLLPSSTFWPGLLVLNLRPPLGPDVTLLVLPDSLSVPSFRSLSVACRWIAAHNNRAPSEKT